MHLQTPRLLVRPFTWRDLDALERIFCDPEVMRFSDHGTYTTEQVRAWLREQVPSSTISPDDGYHAVVVRDDHAVIGYIALTHNPERCEPDEVEIGWRLSRNHWGNGYGTEVAVAARDHAFKTLGFNRLIAIIDPANTPSVRIAEKLGMTVDREVMFPGYTHPDRVYALTRESDHHESG